MTFSERLQAIQVGKHSLVCIGLDPDLAKVPAALRSLPPARAIVRFLEPIIRATAPFASAFKINFAFFEAYGAAGWDALAETRSLIPSDTLAIADAKRGDIGNSATFYARSVFEDLTFDACTVSPYMGYDSVEPFLQYPGRAAIVLGRTSNPGGADLQEIRIDGEPLYLRTARLVTSWGEKTPGDVGLVVGATHADPVHAIRKACPTLPFLIPGVGAQGGDPTEILPAAGLANGLNLINSSRQILYASAGDDFAEAAGKAAFVLQKQLHAIQVG